MATGDIAAAIGRKAQDSTFKRALGMAEAREYVVKAKRGLYAAGKAQAAIDVS